MTALSSKSHFIVPFAIFLLSQWSWVVSKFLTTQNLMKDQRWVFATGVTCLILATFGPAFVFSRYFRRVPLLLCVFSVFCWSCMIDLGIGLELDGFISNFIGFYFAEGEPYLMTAHGTLINYWDGIVHFSLYLLMIGLYTKRVSHREVGLYWVGSILNSMIVLLQGGIAGNHPFKMSILLNVPYILFPLLAGYMFLHDRPPQARTFLKFPPLWKRPVDLLFFLYFIVAIAVVVFRGMVVLGGNADAMKEYIKTYEPYMADPTGFPKFQVLAHGYFYFVYYLSAAYGLMYPGQHWMADWALIHAGASAQGQATYIGGAIHHRTQKSFHAPHGGVPALIFWVVNLGLLVVPHIFAWWCQQDYEHFGRTYSVDRGELIDEADIEENNKRGKYD